MWGYSPLRNCPGVMRISIKLYIYIKQPAPRTWKSCTVRSTSLKLTRTSEVVLALGVQPRVCVSGWQRSCKIQHPAPIPWLVCYWYAIYANLPKYSINGFSFIGKVNASRTKINQPHLLKTAIFLPLKNGRKLSPKPSRMINFPGCWWPPIWGDQSNGHFESPGWGL